MRLYFSASGNLLRGDRRWTYGDPPVGWAGFLHVGAEEVEDDGEPFEVKYPRLLAELEEELTEGERLTVVVRGNLQRLHGGNKP